MSSYSYDGNPFDESYGYEVNRQSGSAPNRTSTQENSDDKIRRNKEQIRDITNQMKQNIDKAMERDVNMSELNRNADDLEFRATDFKRTSTRAKKHFFMKNAKWTIILIVVVLLILIIIGLIIGLTVSNNSRG